jgi:hypothetical protein
LPFGENFSGSQKTAEFVQITCGNGKNMGWIAPNSGFYKVRLKTPYESLIHWRSNLHIPSLLKNKRDVGAENPGRYI